MAARSSSTGGVNEYEQKRMDRIAANQAKLDSMGVLQQKTMLESSFRAVRRPATPSKTRKGKGLTPATRQSLRLQKVDAEDTGLTDFPDEGGLHSGKALPPGPGSIGDAAWLCSKERRCGQKGRGSIYDNVAGITCHFCRQKKLCGEEDCKRCSERDVEKACIGKSECSRCESACGRFCRACLLVRYGMQLEAVRAQMEAATWLCPHCYEADHPEEDWICNSSICMTKRGLKPTGIAIFEAQQQGFASVAHYVQAQLASRRGSHVANSTAGPIKVTAAASAAQAELPNLSDHGSTTESDTEETAPVEAEVVTEDTRPEPKTAGALCLPSSEAEAAKGGRPGSSSLSAASLQAPHSAAECLPGSDLPAASSATAIDCGPGSQLQTVGVITRDAAGEPKAACIDGVAGCKAGHAVQTQHAVRGKDCQPGISGGDRVTGGKGLQTGVNCQQRLVMPNIGNGRASHTKAGGILEFVVPVRRSARNA